MIGLIDCHNHTNFSCDASHRAEDTFEAARRKGLGGVCVTDHYDLHLVDGVVDPQQAGPWGSDTSWVTCPAFTLEAHCKRWKQRRDALRVAQGPFLQLFGVEIGYYPQAIEQLNHFIRHFEFDQVIGSVHTFDGKDLNVVYDDLYQEPQDQVYRSYLRSCIDLVSSGFEMNILGHFDYVSRYAPTYEDPKMYYRDFSDEFDTLFTELINRGISLEVNTGYTKARLRQHLKKSNGSRQSISTLVHEELLMDDAILRRYQDLGGSMISLSSDSHRPEDTGGFFAEHAQYLASLGVTHLTYFIDREPHTTPLVLT